MVGVGVGDSAVVESVGSGGSVVSVVGAEAVLGGVRGGAAGAIGQIWSGVGWMLIGSDGTAAGAASIGAGGATDAGELIAQIDVLRSEDVAETVAFVATVPKHVNLTEITILPTAQII